jgi:hypothetical protein
LVVTLLSMIGRSLEHPYVPDLARLTTYIYVF